MNLISHQRGREKASEARGQPSQKSSSARLASTKSCLRSARVPGWAMVQLRRSRFQRTCSSRMAVGGWELVPSRRLPHAANGHGDKEIVCGGYPVRSKDMVLGSVSTAGRTQSQCPRIEGPKRRAEGARPRVAGEFMGRV
jgi:hypothetical protein